MTRKMHSYINMAWNFQEWLNSQRTLEDVLWLYTGFINDSVVFNIVEYICIHMGLIR